MCGANSGGRRGGAPAGRRGGYRRKMINSVRRGAKISGFAKLGPIAASKPTRAIFIVAASTNIKARRPKNRRLVLIANSQFIPPTPSSLPRNNLTSKVAYTLHFPMDSEQSPTQQPKDDPAYSITRVTTPDDLTSTIALFHEYAASLNMDLSFQDFASEVANMPGKYSHPTGTLLLARTGAGTPIGCVGLRPLEGSETCEMKRLYVSPLGRGTGVGKALAVEVLKQARKIGYRRVRLDTLRSMASAKALYEKLGFLEVDPYYNNPLDGATFLELTLEEGR